MCGISGIFTKVLSNSIVLERLREMGAAQRHRGPDDADEMFFSSSGTGVGLGFVRLSILDLETGMQPIVHREDGSAIVCNGQVYNYVELKNEVSSEHFSTRGDMEVALHLYRLSGIKFLDSLNGMYAGAIFDPLKRRVLLFRDRFGIKPLYYCVTSEGFFFSSEIRALLDGSGIPAEIDSESLPVYFSYRYIPGERTMFKGIRRLPPGSYLDFDLETNTFTIRRYWEYIPGRNIRIEDERECEERFIELLQDAVRIRMRSDVEVGSLLSGGIDSSSVASIAASLQPDMKLFTISFDDPLYNELGDVREFIGSEAGTFSNTTLIHRLCSPDSLGEYSDLIRSVEDCISLGTIIPTDQICRLASDHVKVVLTGEGADEIFAGYRKFLLEMAAEEIGIMSPSERSILMRDFPELERYLPVRTSNPRSRFIQSELLFSPLELTELLDREISVVPFPEDAMPVLDENVNPVDQLLAMECRSRLPDYVVLRLDKLSMRHSLETRTPYLDFRLAEFAADLPIRMKVNLARRMGKFICRTALENKGIVDSRTAQRRKKPFTIPMAAWLLRRHDVPGFIRDIFEGSETERQGILAPGMVRQMWGRISSEGVGPDTLVSEADRVFAVMTFSLWMKEYIG